MCIFYKHSTQSTSNEQLTPNNQLYLHAINAELEYKHKSSAAVFTLGKTHLSKLRISWQTFKCYPRRTDLCQVQVEDLMSRYRAFKMVRCEDTTTTVTLHPPAVGTWTTHTRCPLWTSQRAQPRCVYMIKTYRNLLSMLSLSPYSYLSNLPVSRSLSTLSLIYISPIYLSQISLYLYL